MLMVALKGCILELNSGESLGLAAGDVVVLEDVLKPGHKVKPLEHGEISVLFLTLPQPYYHTGKEHSSLPNTFISPSIRRDPCPSDPDVTPELLGRSKPLEGSPIQSTWSTQKVRRLCLGIFGLSVSTLAADFLGKTAPLWLAVGIGGTSFVVAVTWATVTGGDALLTHLDLFFERRKLFSPSFDEQSTDVQTPDMELVDAL